MVHPTEPACHLAPTTRLRSTKCRARHSSLPKSTCTIVHGISSASCSKFFSIYSGPSVLTIVPNAPSVQHGSNSPPQTTGRHPKPGATVLRVELWHSARQSCCRLYFTICEAMLLSAPSLRPLAHHLAAIVGTLRIARTFWQGKLLFLRLSTGGGAGDDGSEGSGGCAVVVAATGSVDRANARGRGVTHPNQCQQ